MTNYLVGVDVWHLERIVQQAKLYATEFNVWNLARLTDNPALTIEAHDIEAKLAVLCDQQRQLMDKILAHLKALRCGDDLQQEDQA